MNLFELWMLVIPLSLVVITHLTVWLLLYVKRTQFLKLCILLHALELFWLISALFGNIPSGELSLYILKLTRYTIILIPPTLLMMAFCIDERYKIKKTTLMFVYAFPICIYLLMVSLPVGLKVYANYYLALTNNTIWYTISLICNVVLYLAFYIYSLKNMQRFYSLSKSSILYPLMNALGNSLPFVMYLLISSRIIGADIDPFSIFMPILFMMLFFTIELPRLRFYDQVQLSNVINGIDYPIAVYSTAGKRIGFNNSFHSEIEPYFDFTSLLQLQNNMKRYDNTFSIKKRYYVSVTEDLVNDSGTVFATVVYFNDVTQLKQRILELQAKIETMDQFNDQLLEEMMIQEKIIKEKNRKEVFELIQNDLVDGYREAILLLTIGDANEHLSEISTVLQNSLTKLRIKVKELRSQAEEIMDINHLISTCLSLYDPERITIEIVPAKDLSALTSYQASGYYLMIRQILDFSVLQPQCKSVNIVLRKERNVPILIAGLNCTTMIDDSIVHQFESQVLNRGNTRSNPINIMNLETGCIIYAALEQ